MIFFNAIKRYYDLGSFWSRRTDFYRDLAVSIAERELPKDFVNGELEIAVSPRTSDSGRAVGLTYMRNLMEAGDPTLHEVLLATMPKGDQLALSILKDAKDRPAALRTLAKTIDNQNELVKMVRQALTTPAILIPVGFAFSYVLSTITIPAFAKAAPPEIWVGYNLAVRTAADFMSAFGPYMAVGGILFFIWLLVWALPNLTSDWRYKVESARGLRRILLILICPVQPVFSLYRDIQGTRMLGNLANLLQSKILLADAVQVLLENSQPWLRRHLMMLSEHLQLSPGDYVGAFSHGILSPFLLARLNSMVRRDAGGEFSLVLIELGGIGQVEGREAVRKSAVSINAFLLVATISVILFFYVGQSTIASAIEDANSPTAVMKRALKKREANAQGNSQLEQGNSQPEQSNSSVR